MSSLTSQQINNSYQGLIKLENSTSGVTASLQPLQDGLGNDLAARVSNTRFVSNNFPSYVNYTPDYLGNGLSTTSLAPIAGQQTGIIATLFYDSGTHSYSAMTNNVITATTTTDVVRFGFYTAQWVDGYGLSPSELVFSGTSIDVASTGIKVTSFGSNQSFSGIGSGIYFFITETRNSGVTPTYRFTQKTTVAPEGAYLSQYGFVANAAGTAYNVPWKNASTTNTGIYYQNLSLQTSYSPSDIITNYNTAQNIGAGFLLNVAK